MKPTAQPVSANSFDQFSLFLLIYFLGNLYDFPDFCKPLPRGPETSVYVSGVGRPRSVVVAQLDLRKKAVRFVSFPVLPLF